MTKSLTCPCGGTFDKEALAGCLPTYCSPGCRINARGRKSVSQHDANGYSHGCRCDACKAAHADRMRDYYRKIGGNPHRKVPPKYACLGQCGRMIRGGTCVTCTPSKKRQARAKATRRTRALARLERASAGTRGGHAWVYGPCAECDVVFTRKTSASQFCSASCSRRVKAARRRALEAGCKITPGRRYAVYERDNWTCRLCHFPVDRNAQVPHFEAPVIDHIVSLARGGEHGPGNWQTAHFLCNSYKRDLDMTQVA